MVEGGNGLRLQFDRMTWVSGEQYDAYGQEQITVHKNLCGLRWFRCRPLARMESFDSAPTRWTSARENCASRACACVCKSNHFRYCWCCWSGQAKWSRGKSCGKSSGRQIRLSILIIASIP